MSALSGKCTQRKDWIGDTSVDSCTVLGGPAVLSNARRFLSVKKRVPPGSRYWMAKPTKSSGGVPRRQFMASSAMPSPRWIFSVKGALALLPLTWNSVAMFSPVK